MVEIDGHKMQFLDGVLPEDATSSRTYLYETFSKSGTNPIVLCRELAEAVVGKYVVWHTRPTLILVNQDESPRIYSLSARYYVDDGSL